MDPLRDRMVSTNVWLQNKIKWVTQTAVCLLDDNPLILSPVASKLISDTLGFDFNNVFDLLSDD